MSRLTTLSTLLCACAAALQSGCVSPGTPHSLEQSRAGLATTARSTDVVGLEEISTITAATAYDAVVQLRPQFLHRRGIARPEQPDAERPIVYLDGVRQGSLEALHLIPVELVREIRFLSPVQAAERFGRGQYGTGAIVISSR